MTRRIIINGEAIHDNSDCYIIAEIGHNHQGQLEIAKRLFEAAKQCGANAVKLQKRDNRALYTKAFFEKPYQHSNSFGRTYGEHREALEFSNTQYIELNDFAKKIGITFFATAFDLNSANFLAKLNVPAFKIASGDLRNIPLLKHIAAFGKPVLLSTGGASAIDVQEAYRVIWPINNQLCLLQCTSGYPCDIDKLNLRVITSYRELYPNTVVGLSAHDKGIETAPIAYALGARIIEKHFTLEHSMKGTDHAFSLDPDELRALVRSLNNTKLALGDGKKKVYACEHLPMVKMGKKLVAARNLYAGHIIQEADIAIKSPGDGLPPTALHKIIGRKVVRDIAEDEAVSPECFDQLEWSEAA